jgi:hypothetical protein
MTPQEVSRKIQAGELLHIAGNDGLLRALPKGNWIGGSIEYFMTEEEGGVVSDDRLFVTELPYKEFSIRVYDKQTIANVANDAYENGFSILILPSGADVSAAYHRHAPEYENLYLRNIAGWVSGVSLRKTGQIPLTFNGADGSVYPDKAVALHLRVPDGQAATIHIINIFQPNMDAPPLTIPGEQNVATRVLAEGKEYVPADYLKKYGGDPKLPLVGDFSGANINVVYRHGENGSIKFDVPMNPHVEFRPALAVEDYQAEFLRHVERHRNQHTVFSCNCLLNFEHGCLEGKKIGGFTGPMTWGEIAFLFVSQTLVYVTVE